MYAYFSPFSIGIISSFRRKYSLQRSVLKRIKSVSTTSLNVHHHHNDVDRYSIIRKLLPSVIKIQLEPESPYWGFR
jgi:hypothetical protein